MIQKPFENRRFWVEALISGASHLLGSGFGALSTGNSNRTNLKIARETNQANRELAELANQWNLEQWNRENEYNSPVAQMERLRAAGLNPNLVYGNGATTTAAKSPSAEVATMQPAHMQPYTNYDFGGAAAVQAYLQSQQVDAALETQGAQRDMLGAQADYLHNKSLRERAETLRALTGNDLDKLTYKQRLELYDDTIEQGHLKTAGMRLGNDKISVDMELSRAKTTETLANVEQIQSKTNLNRAEALVAVNRIQETVQHALLMQQERELVRAKTRGETLRNDFDSRTMEVRVQACIDASTKAFEEIVNLQKQGKLTDAKIDQITHDMRLDWARYGLDVAEVTSREARNWVYGWIPGNNN